MGISLAYGDVENVIAGLHGVASSKRAALRSRFRHFQRLGFPPGINTGKGRRAAYGAGELVQLLCAFELSQLGMPPERIVRLLTADYDALADAAGFATTRSLFGLDVTSVRDAPEHAVLFRLDPMALAGLREDGAYDVTAKSFDWEEADEFATTLKSVGLRFRRLAVIDISRLIDDAALMLQSAVGIQKGEFVEAIKEWADGKGQ